MGILMECVRTGELILLTYNDSWKRREGRSPCLARRWMVYASRVRLLSRMTRAESILSGTTGENKERPTEKAFRIG